MLAKLNLLVVSTIGALLGFTLTAHAANAVDPADGSLDLAKNIYSAFAGGHGAYAAALGLVLAVALLRKYGGSRWPALHTDAGATLLVLGGSFGGALSASLAGGGPLTASLAWSATCIAFAAAGGYAAVKRLVIAPMAPRLPPWLAGPLLWLFSHASDPGNTPPAASAQ